LDAQSTFKVNNPKKLDFWIFVGLDYWIGLDFLRGKLEIQTKITKLQTKILILFCLEFRDFCLDFQFAPKQIQSNPIIQQKSKNPTFLDY
jgi:hypothetical protein